MKLIIIITILVLLLAIETSAQGKKKEKGKKEGKKEDKKEEKAKKEQKKGKKKEKGDKEEKKEDDMTEEEQKQYDEIVKHLRERENFGEEPHTTGYIPEGTKSGVTISTGLDLGQHNKKDLKKLGLKEKEHKKLLKKLCPYLELKTPEDVEKAGLKPEDLKISEEDALLLEKLMVEPHIKAIKPYVKKMGTKGFAVLVSLRHWASRLYNSEADGKLSMDVKGKVVNHVWEAVKDKCATLEDLKKALEKTLKLHKKGTAAYNRIQHEIDYINKK